MTNYYQVLCPCTGGAYRICWVCKSAFEHTHRYAITGVEAAHPHKEHKKCSWGAYYYTGKTSKLSSCTTCYTSKMQYPMKNYHTNFTQWGKKVSYMSAQRNYHIGIDYGSSTDKNVYAIANGTVAEVGYNSANGNYIVIKHTISEKAVYSFYAHLKSYSVSKGSSVTAGKKIAVVDATESSANGTVHLHFAITDALWSGSYYGYAPYFSGNKTRYNGVTYYNPEYVIRYGKLP